jgi:hypothetical protein
MLWNLISRAKKIYKKTWQTRCKSLQIWESHSSFNWGFTSLSIWSDIRTVCNIILTPTSQFPFFNVLGLTRRGYELPTFGSRNEWSRPTDCATGPLSLLSFNWFWIRSVCAWRLSPQIIQCRKHTQLDNKCLNYTKLVLFVLFGIGLIFIRNVIQTIA